jgi:metaxin
MTSSIFSLPDPLRNFLSRFPLHTYPPISSPYHTSRVTQSTLWIHPPRSLLHIASKQAQHSTEDVLSSDVECLKWQAYLALRNLSQRIAVRWDVSPDGGIDGRLPNLHVPIDPDSKGLEAGIKDDREGDLLAAHLIPEWVDGKFGDVGPLEGYADETAKDESRAWVALLEGNVHAALVSYASIITPLLSFMLVVAHTSHLPQL